MTEKTFIFAGNRFAVLKRMIDKNMSVGKILATPGSFLARELDARGIAYVTMSSIQDVIRAVDPVKFDVFVSNGCPFILPSALIDNKERTFVNVHPSLLPDLRGRDPIPGAILHGRVSGVTCHLIDKGIDTGPIISQVPIDNTVDLDAGLLYQMSFMIEPDVFDMAIQRNFKPMTGSSKLADELIYYSVRDDDKMIDFRSSAGAIVRRIRAFSTGNQGAFFWHSGRRVRVFDAEVVSNKFWHDRISGYQVSQVALSYEKKLLVRCADGFVKLKNLDIDAGLLSSGSIISDLA